MTVGLVRNISRLATAICFFLSALATVAQDRATGALPVAKTIFAGIDKAPAIPGSAIGEPKVSWRKRFPKPMNQGTQQSCTAFATAYALKTFLERKRLGWTDDDPSRLFSPAFIYNPFAHGDGTQGIYVQDALTYLAGGGCCTLKTMPYDPNDVANQPTREARREAYDYRIERWDTIDVANVAKVKTFLAAGKPVVIVAFVDTADDGKWAVNAKGVTDHYLTDGPKPTNSHRSGCHAMVAVGYDDDRKAFEVMNSWGSAWNDGGFGWIAYSFWPTWVNEGYIATNKGEQASTSNVGVSSKELRWLPVGPEGSSNGNWGYSQNIDLQQVALTKEKKLPPAVKQELKPVLSAEQIPSTGLAAIRTLRVTVPASSPNWKDSEVSLSEAEQARITVDPAFGNWVVRGKKPSSVRGLGASGDSRLMVPNRPIGGLIVKDGDGDTYAFDRGVDALTVRAPGRIRLICNEVRPQKVFGKVTSGYDDNKGEVVAIIEVFPKSP